MMEITGGDDNDDEEINVTPSHRDALAASMTLQRYVADINDSFARKLEAILASFGRQVRLEESRTMRSTQITDCFTSNQA